jgi:hypothetical protein
VVAPAYGDYTSDFKKEILRQRTTVKEGNNPLRTWYFAIRKLNARFKEREAARAVEFYRYHGGRFADPDRIESFYLLNNKVVHVHFPFVDIKDSIININVRDNYIIDKYFTVKTENTSLVNVIGMPYYVPTVKLDFGFVDELAANIATAKIGKQNGLNYQNYKKKAEIRLQYLKDVYTYIKKRTSDAVCIGQLIVLFEKELARL